MVILLCRKNNEISALLDSYCSGSGSLDPILYYQRGRGTRRANVLLVGGSTDCDTPTPCLNSPSYLEGYIGRSFRNVQLMV